MGRQRSDLHYSPISSSIVLADDVHLDSRVDVAGAQGQLIIPHIGAGSKDLAKGYVILSAAMLLYIDRRIAHLVAHVGLRNSAQTSHRSGARD
jgi:hypothetical protein